MAETNWGGLLASGLGLERAKEIRLKEAHLHPQVFGIRSSWSGAVVTAESALQLSAVWACVRLISQTISTLPLVLYRQRRDGSREPDTGSELYELLKSKPNADMSAVVFWNGMLCSLLMWGNAYARVTRRDDGSIVALEYLQPNRVTLQRIGARKVWRYTDPDRGTYETLSEERMFHVRSSPVMGDLGLSPISYGTQVFGNAMAAEKASASTFRDDLRTPGIVTVDTVLNPKSREDIRQHVKQVGEEGGVFVLEKGSSFQPLSLKPEDAELLASRNYGVEECCRWFGVPPFMVGHGEKSSNFGTGLEEQKDAFVTYVLRWWCKLIEDEIMLQLVPAERRAKSAVEYAMEGLLRGNSTARGAFYSQMLQNGVYSRDEVRAMENMPLRGGNADELTVQVNLVPIDKLGEQARAGENPASAAAAPAPAPSPEPTA